MVVAELLWKLKFGKIWSFHWLDTNFDRSQNMQFFEVLEKFEKYISFTNSKI